MQHSRWAVAGSFHFCLLKLTEQEYFIANSNVVYLNCLVLEEVLDEGRLVHSFLQCSEITGTGTYIILISRHHNYEITHYGAEILIQKIYGEDTADEAVLYVCRRL